jgi:hypothetical protein
LDTLNRSFTKPINDVLLVTQPVEGDASSVSVWVKSGSALESKEQLGVSNLLRSVLSSVCFLSIIIIIFSSTYYYRIFPKRLPKSEPQFPAVLVVNILDIKLIAFKSTFQK